MYFSAGFIFVTNLFFIFLTIALIDKIVAPFSGNNKINIAFGIIFGIACLISLITVGIYRYAKYRIDLALYLRRRGQSINLEHEPSDSDNKPTSSLTANADSK
jgi:hypothetical protein